jgi:prepilin-type N-terminal cleavage/methylation domain-containing protein
MKHTFRQKTFALKGFTLIEMMAASAIMAVSMVLVLQTVGFVLDGFNRSSTKLETSGRAQFAMQQIANDLQCLQFRKTAQNYEFLRAVTNPVAGGPGWMNVSTTNLYMLTSATDATDGDVAAVGYKINYQNPIKNGTSQLRSYALYRSQLTSALTFQRAYGLNLADTSIWSGNYSLNDQDNLLVNDVCSLRIIFYYLDDENKLTPFEGTVANPLPLGTGSVLTLTSGEGAKYGSLTNKEIVCADIELTLLTSQAAQMVNESSAPQPPGFTDEGLSNWLMRNSQTIRYRVKMSGQSF